MPTKLTRGAALIAALAAGAFAGLSGVSHADHVTDGSGGIGSGNQVNIPIDVAVELCGNSVAVVGVSEAECVQIAEELASDGANQASDGSGGVASGNQINIPVDIAVSLCGNSIAVAGVSQAQCEQVAQQLADDDDDDATNQTSDGSGGVGSGNQVDVPIDADVEICGNAVAVLGVANAECVTSTEEAPEEPGDGCDGNEEECEEGDGGGGDPGCEDENGKDCSETPDPEEQTAPDSEDETPDDANPPNAAHGDSALPTTGSALHGILIAALALVTFGGGAIYLGRRRRLRTGGES